MAKLPYFPFDAREYLLDTKVRALSKTERAIIVELWCWMWVNSVKRGHLLERTNGKIRALSDEEIVSMLQLTSEEWQVHRQKLVEKVGILKIGKFGEMFSQRLSKHKTDWELYPRQSRTLHGKDTDDARKNIIELNGIKLELNIMKGYYANLCKTYPDLEHDKELLKADSWHKAQPKFLKKKNHHSFLNNWFNRASKEKKDGTRTGSHKRLNPETDPSKFGKPGFQKIPDA